VSQGVEYRRFVPAEADLLAEVLTAEDWPYLGTTSPDRDRNWDRDRGAEPMP
jgi:hypothetical protein